MLDWDVWRTDWEEEEYGYGNRLLLDSKVPVYQVLGREERCLKE